MDAPKPYPPPDHLHAMSSDSSGPLRRRRIVSRQWLRDPGGELLPRPPPVGTRPPNGLVWGHSCEDFMWIQRVPNVNVLTVWSRSMIKEFGENYDESEFDAPEPRPRVRRPWPVLRIARDALNTSVPPLGAYDDGSDHEDDDQSAVRRWRVRADDPKTGEAREDKILNRFVVEGLADALMPNDGKNPVISPLKRPYAALWKPELREQYAAARGLGALSNFTLVRKPGSKDGRGELLDGTGLMAIIVDEAGDCYSAGTPRLLVMDGDRDLFVRHDPSPVIFVDRRTKPASEEATTEKAPEGSAETPGRPPEGSSEDVAGMPDEAAPVPTEKNETEGDTEAQLEPKTPPGDGERDTAGESSTATEGTQALQELAGSSIPPSTNKGEARSIVIGLIDSDSESEGGEGVAENGDHDNADADDVEPEEEDPAKYLDDNGQFDRMVLASLPKLEEFIPEEYFPDALMVIRTGGHPKKYKRILPKFERDGLQGAPERLATLYFNGPTLGEGHHSTVRRAPLKLPAPLSAYGRHRMVTVAAKRSFGNISARKFLRHEAGIFSLFPRHLQEEYCGYNLVTPIRYPVPVGAVVPKFYGYYVPVEDDGSVCDHTYEEYDEEDMRSVEGFSPLLLTEECGEPIVPRKFSVDDRSECYSLMCRLQLARFSQGSMYVRNILWQPGPLWKPPRERSRATPSFRIIDFGRAVFWDELVAKVRGARNRQRKSKEWGDQVNLDRKRFERELLIEDWDY
ncbi:hypothetical protein DAEQUDRAFT_732892 [Daedalea quercina L-15889]|uniref:Protein kinase domain-containing protein n=1 Tax=Daedalea quercina L-15889 TaxID=1314783 RepID=A0A165LC51_9APHY|nr:hypothetical protein DAEQUDRAFT_732892 [Daedalea quercina L-15889]